MSMLDGLIRSVQDQSLLKLYKQVFGIIIQHDYPSVWPECLDTVVDRLGGSQNIEEIQGCLLALEKIFAKFELELDNRQILEHIATRSIVVLQNLAGQMIQNYSAATAPLLKSVLKIFFKAINMDFPTVLAEESTLHNWMAVIKLIISQPIPSEVNSSQNPSQSVFWKNRKWAIKISIKMLTKYCFIKSTDKKIANVSYLFLNKYSVSFVESIVEILFNQYLKGSFVSDVVLNSSLLFIHYALRYDQTFNALYQILEKIALDVCVPILYTTPEDFTLYNSDPEDYLRKDEDTTISMNKNAAVMLIKDICKLLTPNKELYLEYVLSLIITSLSTGSNPRTNQMLSIAQKEGLFYLMGVIRDQVYEEKNLTDKLEAIIQNYIIPELSSQAMIMRARTCWLLGRYGGLLFINPQNLANTITGISSCMIGGDLVVRVKASIALQYFIDQDGVKDLVRPGLSDMLSIYIKLMTQIDNEHLVSALEAIVENFTLEITPFAYDLAQHLAFAFYRYREKDLDDDQAGEDGELPAAGCLQAINQILESPLDLSIYAKMESDFLFKLIIDCLTDKDCHYIEEGFGILNNLLFKSPSISNNLWIFYPFICYAIIGFPQQLNVNSLSSQEHVQLFSVLVNASNYKRKQWVETLDSMIGPMKNFFQKGGEVILTQNDPFNQSLRQLLFETVKSTYLNTTEFTEVDQMLATLLLIGFVENMHAPAIDGLVAEIIGDSIVRISGTKCKPLKVVNLQVISLCLHYSASLTLQVLEQNNQTRVFFAHYFELMSNFRTDFEKKRMLLGISSIFMLNESQIPATITDSMQGIMQLLVRLCLEIVELREKGEKSEEEAEEEKEQDVHKFNQQLLLMNNGNGQLEDQDDDEDDDEDYEENVEFKSKVILSYTSPLEVIDEIIYLEQVLTVSHNQSPNLYAKLIACLTLQETAQLQACVSYAKQQQQQQQHQQQIQ